MSRLTLMIALAVAAAGALSTGCSTIRRAQSKMARVGAVLVAVAQKREANCQRRYRMSCAQARARARANTRPRRVAQVTQPNRQATPTRTTSPRVVRDTQVTRSSSHTTSSPRAANRPAKPAKKVRARPVNARSVRGCGRISTPDMRGTLLLVKDCQNCVKKGGTYRFTSPTQFQCQRR